MAFQEGLQQLGWTQGRNVSIDYRWAEDRQQINATELVKMAPDVLVAVATPAVEALRQQTHSLPIVFVQVSDPVKLGVVANLARPGANITGFTNFEHAIGGKWLELIRDTVPGAMRVLVIFEPNQTAQLAYLQAMFGVLVQIGDWQAPFIVAAALLVIGSAVWAFWLDPDKHILTG